MSIAPSGYYFPLLLRIIFYKYFAGEMLFPVGAICFDIIKQVIKYRICVQHFKTMYLLTTKLFHMDFTRICLV